MTPSTKIEGVIRCNEVRKRSKGFLHKGADNLVSMSLSELYYRSGEAAGSR
jgi:hypothetical protein